MACVKGGHIDWEKDDSVASRHDRQNGCGLLAL